MGIPARSTSDGPSGVGSGFPCDPAVLAAVDTSVLDDDGCLTVLAGVQRLIAAAQALEARALERLTRLRPKAAGEPFGEFVADEVAVELCLTRNAAESRLAGSVEMVNRVPVVLKALDEGVLDLYRAGIVTQATFGLDIDTAVSVAEYAVQRAAGATASQLRSTVRRAVLKFDSEGERRRHAYQRRKRRVVLFPMPDGMTELAAYLPAETAEAINRRVDLLARKDPREPGDARTHDERRADVLSDLLLGRGSGSDSDSGLRPLVHVTVAATTLLGLDDKPGELAGYGAVSADVARRLACDTTGTLRRLVTDPTDGSLVELTRTTYRPPVGLDEYVRARDGNCRFPGCRHPAQDSDLDHTVRWPDGPTAAGNLAALCRAHHALKHKAGWKVWWDGKLLHWRSPTGREYTTRPADHHPP